MPENTPMRYAFTLSDTKGTVGYVSCNPAEAISFDDALAYLEAHPFDDFMHKYLLDQIPCLEHTRVQSLLEASIQGADILRPALAALLLETCLLHKQFATLLPLFPPNALRELRQHTPLIYLKWWSLADREDHTAWSAQFKANMHSHRILPLPDDMDDFDLAMLYQPEADIVPAVTTLAEVHADLAGEPYPQPWQRPAPESTAIHALERLTEHNIIAEVEMRHIASLSPIALLRRWNLNSSVQCGRHDLTLQGLATSYGRGLSLADTRAGYAMEIVERSSSFASIGPATVLNTAKPHPIMQARFSELAAKGITAMDPNIIPLEVPYNDEPLYWMQGHTPGTHGPETVMVPVQMVYMFCNLDEISLFSAQGSTGLASGNILEEAKVSALTEIIERDAEATKPFVKSQCFQLTCEDPKIKLLLEDYAARGVHVMFQDITTEFGIPCFKAFVMSKKGEVIRGTGAGLNAQRAVLSALTETPYPYPQSQPSAPALRALPTRAYEELPNYALEDPIRNLELLERTLIANNRRPIYVELQRADLQLPVVKAFIPGLELTADFDCFTRVSKRLFANYLRDCTE